MSTEKTQETKDAELVALAALAHAESVWMDGENQYRLRVGETPVWICEGSAATELRTQLMNRGYKV